MEQAWLWESPLFQSRARCWNCDKQVVKGLPKQRGIEKKLTFFLVGTCRCFPFLLDVVCFFVFLFYRLVLFILIFLWLASIFYRSVLPFFPRLSLKRISRFTIPPSRAVSHRLPMPQTSIGSTSKVEEVRCRAFVLFGVQ